MIGGDGSGTFTIEPLTKNTDELYESYSKGREDAWEAARKIVALSDDDRIRYFGTGYVLEEYSPKEAIEKLRQYEKEVENFEIGDEVESALVRKEDAINAIAEHLGIPASTWRPIAEGWLKNVPVMVPSFSSEVRNDYRRMGTLSRGSFGNCFCSLLYLYRQFAYVQEDCGSDGHCGCGACIAWRTFLFQPYGIW